jgi:hypothetical protein
VNAPHLVALVPAGARFEKGILVERPDAESGGDQQVACHADPQVLTIPLEKHRLGHNRDQMSEP